MGGGGGGWGDAGWRGPAGIRAAHSHIPPTHPPGVNGLAAAPPGLFTRGAFGNPNKLRLPLSYMSNREGGQVFLLPAQSFLREPNLFLPIYSSGSGSRSYPVSVKLIHWSHYTNNPYPGIRVSKPKCWITGKISFWCIPDFKIRNKCAIRTNLVATR